MQARAAERLGIDHLAGRALHQVGAAQPHETGALHHDDDVAERRQVRAAGDARAHHRGDLRNPQLSPHERVVVEDAAGAVLAREDAVLVGEIDARRIHQVDDRQAIAHGDLLRAQNLRDGLRPPGAGLHGGVVGHNHGRPAFDPAEARDDAGGGSLPVIAVVGDEQADFQEGGTRIEQTLDALARGHLAGAVLAVDARRSATLAEAGFQVVQLLDQEAHVRLACDVHGYFKGEKSVGSMNTESTCWTILPLASDSAATFFHSGSLRKAAQFALAASRLGCSRM